MNSISQLDLIENLNFDNLLKGCSSLNDIYLTLELSGLNTTKWLPIELNKENLLVTMQGLEGYAFAGEGSIGVVLDTHISEELREEFRKQ